MEKLAILGQKGGCGKSTTALGLAVAASMAGIETAVIDLDPQATASKWSDRRDKEAPAVVSCQVSRLSQVLDAAERQGAKLAIIDTPGKSTDAAIAAAKVASFVLVPIQPQLFDIETLEAVKDILMLAGKPPSCRRRQPGVRERQASYGNPGSRNSAGIRSLSSHSFRSHRARGCGEYWTDRHRV